MPKTLPAAPAEADVKIVSRKVEFDGWHRLETIVAQPRSLLHGGWADEIKREVLFGGKIACILLYVPETDEILLNQQFRLGACLAGAKHPFLFECAAGYVDDGESVEEAARREALEETGAVVTEIAFAGNCYTSAGCLAEEFHLFVGRIEKAEAGVYGMRTEGEEIKTHLLPRAQVMRMLDEGHITNAPTAVLIHWFERNGAKLRKQWLEEAA